MFFSDPSTRLLIEQTQCRTKRLRLILKDLSLLEAFDQKLNMFDNSTQGLNNRRIVLEAIENEFREPLQILINAYRDQFNKRTSNRNCSGDLIKVN